MRHRCDKCDREASVHEVTIRSGKKVEKHLCAECAAEEGIAVHHAPIGDLITKFVMSHSTSRPAQERAAQCEACGLEYKEFRQQGVLGCPDCYAAFESQLVPLLERAHNDGSVHMGKVPRRGGASLDRQLRIGALRRQLSEAIEAEEYERAAQLRDQISNVQSDDIGRSAQEME